jgi:hypothetical protein
VKNSFRIGEWFHFLYSRLIERVPTLSTPTLIDFILLLSLFAYPQNEIHKPNSNNQRQHHDFEKETGIFLFMEIHSVVKTISSNERLIRTLSQKCDTVLIFEIFIIFNKVLLEDIYCPTYLDTVKKYTFE